MPEDLEVDKSDETSVLDAAAGTTAPDEWAEEDGLDVLARARALLVRSIAVAH